MNKLSSAIVSVLINNKNVQEKKKSDAENMYIYKNINYFGWNRDVTYIHMFMRYVCSLRMNMRLCCAGLDCAEYVEWKSENKR